MMKDIAQRPAWMLIRLNTSRPVILSIRTRHLLLTLLPLSVRLVVPAQQIPQLRAQTARGALTHSLLRRAAAE